MQNEYKLVPVHGVGSEPGIEFLWGHLTFAAPIRCQRRVAVHLKIFLTRIIDQAILTGSY